MKRRLFDRRLLKHFGLEKMGTYWNHICNEKTKDIEFAISNNQMLAVSGEVGSGKSNLFEFAISKINNLKVVNVENYNKEKVTINNIINAIIDEVSSESPNRCMEARSKQVKRLLGETVHNNDTKVVLVIEEAHRLHIDVYRALKELREAKYLNHCPLLSVVLIGHPELTANLKKRKEVSRRCNMMLLNEENGWMTKRERTKYLKQVFGEAISDEARKRIVVIKKTPLAMDEYVEELMRSARKAGKKIIDGEVVQPSTRELVESLDLSLKEAADLAGVSKTTMHNVVNNTKHPQVDKINAVLEKAASKKITNQNLIKTA